ncbi:MAG: hypothetical protein WB791_02245 [Waddliaceae bacterium]
MQNVLISGTIRPGTLGLWHDKKEIIIHRSQLENLQAYSATLLHEAGHALSGASDILPFSYPGHKAII